MIINSYTYQVISTHSTLFHESIYNVTITEKTLADHLPFMNNAKFVTAMLGIVVHLPFIHALHNTQQNYRSLTIEQSGKRALTSVPCVLETRVFLTFLTLDTDGTLISYQSLLKGSTLQENNTHKHQTINGSAPDLRAREGSERTPELREEEKRAGETQVFLPCCRPLEMRFFLPSLAWCAQPRAAAAPCPVARDREPPPSLACFVCRRPSLLRGLCGKNGLSPSDQISEVMIKRRRERIGWPGIGSHFIYRDTVYKHEHTVPNHQNHTHQVVVSINHHLAHTRTTHTIRDFASFHSYLSL
jgi:hypothetical protein